MFEINQIKSDFEDISFNPFNKSDSLFEDPNDPDSHYFDERDYESKYLHVNQINTFLYDLTQHENLSLLHLNIRSLRSNLDDFHTLLEEINALSTLSVQLKHDLMTISLKQIRITTYQIMKEFIMKEKLTKEGVEFLCMLGMTSPIKIRTICVFLMAIEKFSQLN